MWGLNWPSSKSTQKLILYVWLSVLLEQSGQLRSFPPWKALATDISLSLGLHSMPDLCLWLRLLRISSSDSSKFCSEAVLSYTALPLKRSVGLFLFWFGFLLFGVSHIFILSFQYSWPVSIVGSPTVLKGVTRRSWRTRHQHLNNAVFPFISIGELCGSPMFALIFLITWHRLVQNSPGLHYTAQAGPELTGPSLHSTG